MANNKEKEAGGPARPEPEAPTRRSFLQDGAGAIGLAALLSSAPVSAQEGKSEARTAGSPRAVGYKIKKWEMTQKPDGRELTAVLEATAEGGESDSVPVFIRWIYSGDTYTVIHHIPATRFTGGVSAILSGKKGPVEGDYRRDTQSVVTISGDGTVHRAGPQEGMVLLKDPYSGLSVQDEINQFLQDKNSGRWDAVMKPAMGKH